MKNYSTITKALSAITAITILAAPVLAFAQFTTPDAGGTGLPNFFFGCSSVTGCILSIINILLAVAGLIAVLVLIIGGFRYVTSFGNEEVTSTAKKMILNAVIGIIIIILSFVIVRVVANVALNPSSI